MELNWEIFCEVCEENGVKFSKEYNGVMYEDGEGNEREITEADVERILSYAG